MNNLLSRIVPFIGMGVAIVLIVAGIILVSYLLLWGAVIGLILFGIVYLKNRFFPTKSTQMQRGNTYEHDDR